MLIVIFFQVLRALRTIQEEGSAVKEGNTVKVKAEMNWTIMIQLMENVNLY